MKLRRVYRLPGTGLDVIETAKQLVPYVGGLLFTSVEKEGKMQGGNTEAVRHPRN